MKPVFTGSGVALVTPFSHSGVDFDSLRNLIEFHIQNGTDALLITGTTGEAPTLSIEEHLEVVSFVSREAKGRIKVIAGCGSNDTAHAIRMGEACASYGADAFLSVSPYYNKTTQKGLFEHYSAILSHAAVPVILYNIPGRTGVNILPETVAKLAERFDNLAGVKECVFEQVGRLLSLLGKDFPVYSGEDALVVPLMSLGGKGVVSVLANIDPAGVKKMVSLCFEGRFEEASDLQLGYLELIEALFCETNPIPVKEAMNLMGLQAGLCRLPLTHMEEANKERLIRALKKCQLL